MAVTAEKDECAGIANMELGMREIDKLICDYTHVGVPILVLIEFIKF